MWLVPSAWLAKLVRLSPKPPTRPGGLSLGQTVNPVVLFWGDNAAGPATCLTGLLWLREKRALSGSSEEPAVQWALYAHTLRMHWMAAQPRPRPLLEQTGPWVQRAVEGPPVAPSSLQLRPLS